MIAAPYVPTNQLTGQRCVVYCELPCFCIARVSWYPQDFCSAQDFAVFSAAAQNMQTDGVLTRGAFGWSGDGNFTSLCPNGTKWVWDVFGECAQDGRDMASIYLGLLSILCFMVSSFPQYHNSCKTGNMDKAISIWFLLLWLGGDSCNLVGSFLADQLPLQKYTAIYYVFADLLMLAMYAYYKVKNRVENGTVLLNVVGVACILGFTTTLVHLPGLGAQQEMIPSGFRGRALLSASDITTVKAFTTKEIIGFCIGSVSSVLYLCSRLPQIYTNFKRKSTEGVSYFLFALVILGNTTYGLSILLKNPDEDQGEKSYVIHHLPWLIGSLGTLCLDLIISIQFIMYRKTLEEEGSRDETTPLMS
ncbi:lysosomal amino acid transporter 1 homolog isoform X2 [Lates calcarifer]|uniref:Lysosomal amino acid transporter 1 homolog n=1 Tax=Lates calcarifer TaxID=8187 RepID=A0AAJ7LT69_LATCA|nr:lysosomal amino acid transporter 1 homolog isoform X2 [Lates calcarifer]